ncbi:MAG: hypothetical protein ABW101_16105 [Candidatus Thiodiazotropha sp.]
MRYSLRRMGLITLMICVIWPQWANAQAEELKVVTEKNVWAVPYAVEIHELDSGVSISGRLMKSASNPSRRFYGTVYVEMLDKDGEVVAVEQAKPQRMGPAKHSQRASFQVQVDSLPHDVDVVRISYR